MGDAKAGSRATRAAVKRTTVRRRAVGTRDRIISHLTAVDEIRDSAGMASTRLAEAVGYPGSSVAFAQLLSGMERDGLIVREIRGKRTYRIALPEGAAAGGAGGPGAAVSGASVPCADGAGADGAGAARPGAGPAALDYDELARRLLVQVVRRLAAGSRPGAPAGLATVEAAGALAENASGGIAVAGQPPDGRIAAMPAAELAPRLPAGSLAAVPAHGDGAHGDGDDHGDADRDSERTALQQTVAGLERELATAWSRHGTLTAENARLREQLTQAQRDLARERTRRAQISRELNQAEVVLLERLLTPASEDGGGRSDATAG